MHRLLKCEVIFSRALTLEGMDVLDQLKVTGNPECMVCGFGQTCPMSALPPTSRKIYSDYISNTIIIALEIFYKKIL
jgi:hypothetical protein